MLHRTRPYRPPCPILVTTIASGHLFQVSRQNLTGRCQRPIVDNRTCPIILGAYWNVTGRCLHHVRSSREKRISPFLIVRLDLNLVFHPPPYSPFRRLAVTPPLRHHRRTLLLVSTSAPPLPQGPSSSRPAPSSTTAVAAPAPVPSRQARVRARARTPRRSCAAAAVPPETPCALASPRSPLLAVRAHLRSPHFSPQKP
jgi:hypothetical protein